MFAGASRDEPRLNAIALEQRIQGVGNGADKIVVTGATGQVGYAVAAALARDNDVIAPARFGNADARTRLEQAGVQCVVADFGEGQLDEVPTDPTYVLHFAVAKTNDW